jgi:signal transduction histidine kinase
MSALASPFGDTIAQRVIDEHRMLAARWLDRLREVATVDPAQIFPGPSLLSHIPELISRIGRYLGGYDGEDIAADATVVLKARELGELRHAQQVSVHHILHEYDLLAGILMTFIREQIDDLQLHAPPAEYIAVMNRIRTAVAVLRRATIETFLDRYAKTITAQARQIERFNRMLSHELRQPVAALHTAVHLLYENPLARTEDKIEVLTRNVDRIAAITRQLEQIARVSAGEVNTPATQKIALTAAAWNAARQLREMAHARGVAVRIAPDLPSVVMDAAALELVFINLLSNAIKYSDPSKAERFVEVRPARATGGYCAFTVADNGIGVPAEHVEGIFGQFVRAHSERDSELAVEGMGLGLSIVRQCLDVINGTIAVNSVDTEGTSFTVTLPVDSRERPTPDPS